MRERCGMAHANSFRELDVYRKAFGVSRAVFKLTQALPREEMYSLTDQARRSSRSVGAQIAEAWGKRAYKRHFLSKLTDADAEQLETQHWIDTACSCGYCGEEERRRLHEELQSVGRMLHSMMRKADMFCGPQKTPATAVMEATSIDDGPPITDD
jgi:four helix bundle protein